MYDWTQYQYLLLGTRRHQGTFVQTPVWFAPESDKLYVFTNARAGKVKRLRNYTDVEVAPCTVRGRPLDHSYRTHARLLNNPSDIDKAHQALRRRYGWQMRLLDWGAALSGRARQRAWIEVDIPATEDH